MTRTISEVTISNKTVEEVKNNIYKWFEKNGFTIITLNSDGSQLNFSGIKIKPKNGKLVALNQKYTLSIVFELEINSKNNDVIIHGEYYVPSVWPFNGIELEFDPNAIIAGLPKRRGYKLKTKFEEFLKSL